MEAVAGQVRVALCLFSHFHGVVSTLFRRSAFAPPRRGAREYGEFFLFYFLILSYARQG
jgi:hypothetical protein